MPVLKYNMGYKDKEKQKEYVRNWLKARREVWLTENGPCAECGSTEGLEVDHIDRSTKVSHRVWSWSEERRSEELSKCQVLCHECHKEKTITESTTRKHGTITMYRGGNCRCDLCKQAKSAENALRKERDWL